MSHSCARALGDLDLIQRHLAPVRQRPDHGHEVRHTPLHEDLCASAGDAPEVGAEALDAHEHVAVARGGGEDVVLGGGDGFCDLVGAVVDEVDADARWVGGYGAGRLGDGIGRRGLGVLTRRDGAEGLSEAGGGGVSVVDGRRRLEWPRGLGLRGLRIPGNGVTSWAGVRYTERCPILPRRSLKDRDRSGLGSRSARSYFASVIGLRVDTPQVVLAFIFLFFRVVEARLGTQVKPAILEMRLYYFRSSRVKLDQDLWQCSPGLVENWNILPCLREVFGRPGEMGKPSIVGEPGDDVYMIFRDCQKQPSIRLKR